MKKTPSTTKPAAPAQPRARRKPWLRRWRNPLVGAAALFLGLLFLAASPSDHYFEISKNIDIFGKMLREVDNNYVDDIEPNAFIRVGLDAMLGSLDPYTNFISASEIEDFQYQSTGQYGGIGALISKRKTRFLVRECYPDKPAYNAGLRAGDQIIAVNAEQLDGEELDNLDVRNLLRGTPGTKVTLTVKRFNQDQPLDIVITRDKIKVDNVAYYGMVDETTGYVTLGSFTKDASQEVKRAYQSLKQDNPKLESLILDLRDNPGGLLYESINLSNLFIPKGSKVVETRGKMEGTFKRYDAKNAPLDLDVRLAVLINGRSASASEIVSGVLQDLDRGIVVGRRSFGKGLVQTTRPLSYRTQLKITTSRYYTPSGRCIQSIDYSKQKINGKKKSVVKIPDSLRSVFYTTNRRPVRDAGGVLPDALIPAPKFHKITRDLIRQDLIFDFATDYHSRNETLAGPEVFEVSDALYEEFVAYVEKQDFQYESRFAEELKVLEGMLKEESYAEEVMPHYETFKAKIDKKRQNDIYVYKDEIGRFLREEIVRRYYNRQGLIQNSLRFDPFISESLSLLNDPKRYAGILSGEIRLHDGEEMEAAAQQTDEPDILEELNDDGIDND